MAAVSPRRQHAQALFAPLGPTYDRYAGLLSFGQDPRWRRFLVSRTCAGPGDTVLDVATGTGAVAAELIRRTGCTVIGLDQSRDMLAEARRRLPRGVELVEGDADHLPFPDGSFAALTFTYLMRYVDDPATTLRELARVVRPGGTIAGLEFGMPPNPAARALWQLYVGVGLPLAGRLISPGWRAVGEFLGPSIEQLWERLPLDRLLGLWREAGIEDVSFRRLSLGGGIVIWGSRGGSHGSAADPLLRSLDSLATPADGERPRAAPAHVGRGGGKPLEDSDLEA
jgi:demethylmenaquinone methyltransferase / 2-methoxy-6-polyprenyl-1,4-benzoquinol methylase